MSSVGRKDGAVPSVLDSQRKDSNSLSGNVLFIKRRYMYI